MSDSYKRMTKTQLIQRLTEKEGANDFLKRLNSSLYSQLADLHSTIDPKSGMSCFEKISVTINQDEI